MINPRKLEAKFFSLHRFSNLKIRKCSPLGSGPRTPPWAPFRWQSWVWGWRGFGTPSGVSSSIPGVRVGGSSPTSIKSFEGEGLGEFQFRRLEKKLSTLPTLWLWGLNYQIWFDLSDSSGSESRILHWIRLFNKLKKQVILIHFTESVFL